MSNAEFVNDWIIVDAVKRFEDDDDLLDVLSDIRNIEEPDYFERESVNLSVDEREDIGITLRGDDNRYVYLHLGDGEGELHVNLAIDTEKMEPYIFMIDQILDRVGSLTINEIQAHYRLDLEFAEAEFYSLLPEELNIVGIRVDLDDGNAIVQEGEGVHILYVKGNGASIDGVIPDDYFEMELREVREFIDEEIN